MQVMLRDSKKNFQICKKRFQEKLTTKIKALKAAKKKLWKGSLNVNDNAKTSRYGQKSSIDWSK